MLNFKFTKYFIIFLCVFLNINIGFSQGLGLFKKNKEAYSTFGFGGGSSHYFGDLSPYSKFYYALYSNVRWNGTLNYQIHFNEKTSARVGFSYIRIFGNDMSYGGNIADNELSKRRLRNLHFRNDMMEFTITGIYTLIPLDNRVQKGQKLQWSPYIGAGVGIAAHNPEARASIYDKVNGGFIQTNNKVFVGEYEKLKPLNNEINEDGTVRTYSLVTPVFPLVLGIKAKLNKNWIVSLEGGFRISLSDYLDDVGGGFYSSDPSNQLSYRADEDYDVFGKPRAIRYRKALGTTDDIYPSTTARQLSGIDPLGKRGTAKPDSYIVTQLTLNYIIGGQVKCPPIK